MNKSISIILIITLLFTSCASILNGKYQKVKINTEANSNVLIDGKKPLMKNGYYKLERNMIPKNITVQKEGYKDENLMVLQYKKSPLYFFSVIPFGISFYSIFFDKGKKSWNYDKEFSLKSKYEVLQTKDEEEKEIRLNNLSIKLDSGEVKYRHFFTYKQYLRKDSKMATEDANLEEPIEVENTIFSSALNTILKDKGYIDTTNKVLKNSYLNNLNINSTIKGYTIHSINSGSFYRKNIFYTDLIIEWEVLDYYQKSIYTQTTESTSSQYIAEYSKNTKVYNTAIKDALENGFVEFMKSEKVKELMNDRSYAKVEESYETIVLDKSPKPVSSLGEAIKSSVTVRTKDGHGSGFVISENGYIITNYHVVSDTAELLIVFNDGREFKPTVERVSKISDLALLKIDAKDLTPFEINKSTEIEIATDIYAVGTPSAEDLSQTISKGIISGIRKRDGGSKLIQTDASINGGNSGGAIVDTKGIVLGVVSSKLMGIGIEGVAFGVPAYEIFEKLKIEIK